MSARGAHARLPRALRHQVTGYSTTLGELRGARATWRADRDEQRDDENETTPVLAAWQYIGSGYLNPGDVLLAAGVEASIRVAHEARHDLRCRPPDDT